MHAQAKENTISPTLSAFIGGLASAIELSISYPFEYTKTVMQLSREQNELGMYRVMRNTVREYGIFSLYRAYSTLLVLGIPRAQVRFGTFDLLHLYLFPGDQTVKTQIISGAIAGAAEAILVMTVTENLKIKFIHDRVMGSRKYRNMMQGIYSISKEMGAVGLYSGLWL